MISDVYVNDDEIPNLDQFPQMTSNVGLQNFGEDDLDAGRKMTSDPITPEKEGAQQPGGNGEEQCIIQ